MKLQKKFNTPKEILQKVYGYDSFRSNQKQIIETILSKQDCLVILPTGAGKSICFQIPALALDGVTIVISPLISLMKDQVDGLTKLGISATAISSLQTKSQQEEILVNISKEKYKIIYVSPERLQTKRFLAETINLNVSLLVVDEAHCISQWGDSFRPEYKEIWKFIKHLKTKPTKLAFTATATKSTQEEICEFIPLDDAKKFTLMTQKENLKIHIDPVENSTFKLLILFRILNKHKNQSGIIFCSTRNMTEQLTSYLHRFAIKCDFYHGKVETKQKQQIQEKFIHTDPSLVVATNAFGMGIDKSSIRFVVHFQVPGSIEDYYQEIGRAGRDGELAHSYLLYTPADAVIIKRLVGNDTKKQKQFLQLQKLIKSKECRSRTILNYFDTYTDICKNCDNCYLHKSKTIHKFMSKTESNLVTKYFDAISNSGIDRKKVPLTDLNIALLAAIQPQTRNQLCAIPGIGAGWLQQWNKVIKPSNTNK